MTKPILINTFVLVYLMLHQVENQTMIATSDNECDIDVEKMIFEVRKPPCLYVTGSADFHNLNMKENAWNGIENI